MRLSIRWQLALVSVTLSLLPIVGIGFFAYRSARGALEQSIRFNLATLASQTDEKLERLLLDRQQRQQTMFAIGSTKMNAAANATNILRKSAKRWLLTARRRI